MMLFKNYVASVASGLETKESARVISLLNITLSGYPTIDGITVSFGDRVLVNGQTDKKTNGIYVAATSSWSRAEDMDARLKEIDRKSTRLNSSHSAKSRMPSSA